MKLDSALENLDVEQLLYICLKLSKIDSLGSWTNPYPKNSNYYHALEKIVPFFGIKDCGFYDPEFIAKFISTNFSEIEKYIKTKTIENSEVFVIPEPMTYNVDYEVWGPATFTERYSRPWRTYDRKWVEKGFMDAYYEGVIHYYGGKYENYEVENFDADNLEIDGFERIEIGRAHV